MRLAEVIGDMTVRERRGSVDAEICALTADSREAGPGSLFFAITGTSHDGHHYLGEALRKRVAGIVAERWPEGLPCSSVPVVLVPNSREALAYAAAKLSGHPSRQLSLVGITGTNGKTTTTYLVEAIVAAAGGRPGVVGTVATRYGGAVRTSTHTTPGPVSLQRLLREMVDDGVSHVALEVSSHALDQHRVDGCHFRVGAFTNLSRDHLDYHGDLESYFASKRRLFSEILPACPGARAVVNVDDSWGDRLARELTVPRIRVSRRADSEAELRVVTADFGLQGSRVLLDLNGESWELEIPLLGEFNLENALVAAGIGLALELPRTAIAQGVARCPQVPGRLERVANRRGVTVLVDYAHTPDALDRVLRALRSLGARRILTVFGCGGDRDTGKRPLMGQVAARGSDRVVVTSDNPRREDPAAIIEQIVPGLSAGGLVPLTGGHQRGYTVEEDRARAIARAAELAGPEDVVLVAGKGHETYQEGPNGRVPFDDRLVVREVFGG